MIILIPKTAIQPTTLQLPTFILINLGVANVQAVSQLATTASPAVSRFSAAASNAWV